MTGTPFIDAVACPGGVELTRCGERINRISADEARELAARLLAAASKSQPATGQESRRYPMRQRDPDNDHRFDIAGVDGYEL